MNIIIKNTKKKKQHRFAFETEFKKMNAYCNCKGQGTILQFVKFLFLLFFAFFMAFPSYAYLEETDDGSTKLSAGEQNTNMYRMTSKGKIALKKLKQIDEMMARGYAAGDGSAKNVQEVTQIVDEQNDVTVRAAAEQARQTANLLQNKSALQQKNNGQTVQMIISVSSSQSRDSETAADLLQNLSRRKP